MCEALLLLIIFLMYKRNVNIIEKLVLLYAIRISMAATKTARTEK